MKIGVHFTKSVLILFASGLILWPKTDAQTAIKLNVLQPAELIANAGPDAVIDVGNNTLLGATPTAMGGTGILTYQWSYSTYLNDGTLANPIATPPGNITFTVTATDKRGCTDNDEIFVTVLGGTTLNETELDAIIKIFPNPTSGAFNINIDHVRSDEMFINLVNLAGKVVFSTMVKTTGNAVYTEIDISTLAKGCYFLQIKGDHETIIRQIIYN